MKTINGAAAKTQPFLFIFNETPCVPCCDGPHHSPSSSVAAEVETRPFLFVGCCHVPDQSDTNANTANYTIHCHTKRPVRLIAFDSPRFTALQGFEAALGLLRVMATQYPWHNGSAVLYILYCNVVCSVVCPLLAAKNV